MKNLFLIFLLCLPLLGWADKEVKVLKKGDLCQGFVFRDAEGKEVSLELFKGKYVVIDGKNIVFVSISSDAQERRWRFELGFLRERLKLQWWLVGNEEFMKAFEIAAIPRLILLDKQGRVLNLNLPMPSELKLKKILSKLKGL